MAVGERLCQYRAGALGVGVGLAVRLGEERRHGLEGEPRMHRLRAVTEKRCHVVLLHGVTRLDHQPPTRAQAGAHEMLPHRTERQQRRNACALGAHLAIGENE